MKAYQYVDQYLTNEKKGDEIEAMTTLIDNMFNEVQREVTTYGKLQKTKDKESATKLAKKVFKKQNNKWLKICSIIKERKGQKAFKETGFVEMAKQSFPNMDFSTIFE